MYHVLNAHFYYSYLIKFITCDKNSFVKVTHVKKYVHVIRYQQNGVIFYFFNLYTMSFKVVILNFLVIRCNQITVNLFINLITSRHCI